MTGTFTILTTPGYDRDYQKLPARIQGNVDQQVLRLRLNPHHPSLRTHKRRGEGEVWQARITQSYRLFFRMEGNTITLLTIGPHEK